MTGELALSAQGASQQMGALKVTWLAPDHLSDTAASPLAWSMAFYTEGLNLHSPWAISHQ